MQLGYMALRNTITINGAAVIALLTFIGNRSEGKAKVELVSALQYYGLGVVMGVVAIAIGYFAQNALLDHMKGIRTRRMGDVIANISIFIAFGSYACFILGSFCATQSFK